MTLDERYRLQKRKSDRLSEELASLELASQLKEDELSGEREILSRLLAETKSMHDELSEDLKAVKQYKREYEVLIAAMREFMDDIGLRFHADESDMEDEDDGV